MQNYNVEALVKKLKWVVNYNEGQPNQNFAGPSTQRDKHFLDALNEAYRSVVRKARVHSRSKAWKFTHDVTWASSDVTLTLPEVLQHKQIVLVRDVTDGVDGPVVDIGDYQDHFEVFRKEEHVLQWGTTGPGRTTTLRFWYLAAAELLLNNNQVPKLVPPEFAMLLVWEAAIELRAVALGQVPKLWQDNADTLTEEFHALVSRGWPMETNIPRIRMTDDAM